MSLALAAPPLLARPAAAPSARVLSLDALRRRAGAWDRLVAEAADAHPFFSRRVVEAHVANGIGPAPSALAVAEGDRLLALLPLLPRRRRIGLWRPCVSGWGSAYTCNGTPLVAADRIGEAAEGLLDGMAEISSGYWLLPALAGEGPVTAALRDGLQRRGWPHGILSAGERAVLDRRADQAAYAAHLSRNRRKALRRHHARLANLGCLEHRVACGDAALEEAVGAFLALEARGWKGRRGTALALQPETERFARDLFRGGGGPVVPRADLLLLDGRPVAASLALVCGGTAHLLKSAYDETLRAHGPGVLLEAAIVQALHANRFAERLDSCALPGNPLDDLYPDRATTGDLLLHAGPLPGPRFLATAAAEAQVRHGRLTAKTGFGTLRLWAEQVRVRWTGEA